ncbi:MAG: molybdopterin-dependent oxidoreductase [Planctomycetota bacterium]|nr:molybdopterin-dependent oxidoreductase [Planctomycetota bacterium]
MFWLSKPFRYVEARPGLLGVGGIVDLPSFGLTYDELASFPAEYQVPNVGAYASQAKLGTAPIRGVRLAALLKHVGAHPEAILVNVKSRSGFVGTLWRREIEPLAIVAYARDGKPLSAELGGPFRLVVPGLHDEARDVWDLAVIEFSDKPASKPRNGRGTAPTHSSQPGEVQGGLSRSSLDPADPRGIVVPPPMQ